MTLEELKALVGGGMEKYVEGVNGSGAAGTVLLAMYCVVLSCSNF